MIATLRGVVQSKKGDRLVLEVGGVGYEVHATGATLVQLSEGAEAFLHIEESFAMYGGGAVFYGFLTANEKEMFLTFKEHVPSTGAKKALEFLEKASKSLPDFRRAILEKDGRILSGVFGFTKKTADKLVDALKDKIEGVAVSGHEKLGRPAASVPQGALAQALSALSSLGYKPSEARTALAAVAEESSGRDLSAEEIVRQALKRL
jgi:holliday junction DNA helicase RuvA